MDFVASKNSDLLSLLANFKAEAAPLQKFMFHDKIVQTIKTCDWWKSRNDCVNQELLEVVDQLLSVVASSAGVERIFSSFVLCIQSLEINSELRKQANWFSYSNFLIRKHWNQSIYWIDSLTICK